MGKITIRDVAREAGVSISLVSLVMNAKRDAEGNLDCNVNKDTARRIAEVADTVGAGDAFTATFAASLMQGLPMEECHRRAVAVAAFVCTRHGAIAPLSEFMKTEITNR